MCSPCWNAGGTEGLGEWFGKGYVCIVHTGKEIIFRVHYYETGKVVNQIRSKIINIFHNHACLICFCGTL